MAYEPTKMALMGQVPDGTSKLWFYYGTDIPNDVDATDYFSNASAIGLETGDMVFISNPDGSAAALARCSAVDADGNGTVTQV